MVHNENITLSMVYQKLQIIEKGIIEINEDLNRVKPEYAAKLKKIEKGKFHTFKTVEEMRKYLDTD